MIFDSYARPEDIRRVEQFNFSCITRWHPCQTTEEVMPGAAQESRKMSSAGTNDYKNRYGPEEIRRYARDTDNVVLLRSLRIVLTRMA